MRCTRWEGGSCTWRGVAVGVDVQDGKPPVVVGEGWQRRTDLLLASSSVQTRLALNRMRVAQECLLQPAALALLQPAVVDLRGHRLLRHPCNHLTASRNGEGGGVRERCVCVERMWNGGLLLVHPAWLCCESGARGRVRERERERECVCGKDVVWWAMCGGGSPVPGIACCANTNCVDTSERWAKLATQIKATAPALM
jgi:hypothetical protein